MRKIFYFSGLHGTGKSTIIKEIKEKYIPSATILDFDQYPLYPIEYLANQIYRITTYYQTIKNTNAPLLLVDRSPFNAILYAEALYKFRENTNFTHQNRSSVHSVFRMIPSEFYTSSYIIFLNLSPERTIENITNRGREATDLMFDKDFVNVLHKCYVDFYNQIKKIMNVAIFEDNENGSYTTYGIVQELQKRCWLQPYEVSKEGKLNLSH